MVHTDAEDVNTLYFSEKDREKSYLAWPFSNEQPCNIKRVRMHNTDNNNSKTIRVILYM